MELGPGSNVTLWFDGRVGREGGFGRKSVPDPSRLDTPLPSPTPEEGSTPTTDQEGSAARTREKVVLQRTLLETDDAGVTRGPRLPVVGVGNPFPQGGFV